MTDMTREEAQAQAAINEILERLTRIETRLCKLMLHQNIHPGIEPAPRPVRWEDQVSNYRRAGL